ncbi:MAG: hypothetical protein ACLQPN_15875 [Bryobacteraceae bacterium]
MSRRRRRDSARGKPCSATPRTEPKSIGADGGEFHSIVVWRGGTLVFDIVEIEEGKRLRSTEIWSLID